MARAEIIDACQTRNITGNGPNDCVYGLDAPSSSRHELQRDAVVAVTQAGGFRAVVEHVSLVAAAARAVVLVARNEELVIGFRFGLALEAIVEARPAGPAVVLGARFEQRQLG